MAPKILSITVITHFIMFITLTTASSAPSSPKCIIFNYGDSNTDGGSGTASNGIPLFPPYGMQFKDNETTPRCSDGKLYIDSLCELLNLTYLSPYLESSGSNFAHGVNFAVGGATARVDIPHTYFDLSRQILQFRWFQHRTRVLRPHGKGANISEMEFGKAIHAFDIGQNDLAYAFGNATNYTEIVTKVVPDIVSAIEAQVKILHDQGATKFLIYNTGPLGCLSPSLHDTRYSKELDSAGCRLIYNEAARSLNEELELRCEGLKKELKDSVVLCVDMYSIKLDLFTNPDRYGFEKPLEGCVKTVGSVCVNPSTKVSFDGVHYTESANQIIAAKVYSGGFYWPKMKLDDFCRM